MAPWYAIPADNKPFIRVAVAEIIVKSLAKLGLEYPQVSYGVRSKFSEIRKILEKRGLTKQNFQRIAGFKPT